MYHHLAEGDGPVIITVPHDGGVRVPGAEIRRETERWALAGYECRDAGTLAIAMKCTELVASRHRAPSLLTFSLHRSHADVNRPPEREPFVDGFACAYDDFHLALDGEIRRILDRHGKCVLVDVHGYSGSADWEPYDVVLGSDGHRTSPDGFDARLAARLVDDARVTFSPNPDAGLNGRFRGGWIVRRSSVKFRVERLEAVQIEFHARMRADDALDRSAKILAAGILHGLQPLSSRYDRRSNPMPDLPREPIAR
jgi:N-formylglutamate amidohydrolase